MKKYALLALATVFMLSFTVMAQDQKPDQPHNWKRDEMKHGDKPMMSPEKRAEKMAKDLGLTAEEKVKVQALFEKQDAKRKEQMEKGEKMRAEMKAKFEAERKSNEEDLTKIIGPDKFKKLQDMRAQKMEKMKEKRENHRDHHPENAPTPPPTPAN